MFQLNSTSRSTYDESLIPLRGLLSQLCLQTSLSFWSALQACHYSLVEVLKRAIHHSFFLSHHFQLSLLRSLSSGLRSCNTSSDEPLLCY